MPQGTGTYGSKRGRPPMTKKNNDDDFIGDLKEGSLKRMLKIKKDDPPLKIGELQRILKTKEGSPFEFRGKQISKFTPLMKKRVSLAITLIRLSKKK